MTKYILLLVVTLLGLPTAGGAQSESDCSCDPYPFVPDPPCFNYCAATVVNMSSPEELFDILNLQEETKEEIISVKANANPPATLAEEYSEAAQEDLRTAFDQANQDELLEMLSRMFGS